VVAFSTLQGTYCRLTTFLHNWRADYLRSRNNEGTERDTSNRDTTVLHRDQVDGDNITRLSDLLTATKFDTTLIHGCPRQELIPT
jgi:hypothetical protein